MVVASYPCGGGGGEDIIFIFKQYTDTARGVHYTTYEVNHNRVEPLLTDSPNKGHHINYLPTKDTF